MTGHTVEIKKGYRWNPVKKKLEKVTTFRKSIAQHKSSRNVQRWQKKRPPVETEGR